MRIPWHPMCTAVLVWTCVAGVAGYLWFTSQSPSQEDLRAPQPQPGERWTQQQEPRGDPWPRADPPLLITIRDAKAGWVRYCVDSGFLLGDRRLETTLFTQIYRPMTTDERQATAHIHCILPPEKERDTP